MNYLKYPLFLSIFGAITLNGQTTNQSNLSTIENLQYGSISAPSYSSAHTWYPLMPNATESTPTSVEIISSNETETVLEVTVPGFYFEKVTNGNDSYTKISFNSPILTGLGLGDDDNEAAWWEFPGGEWIPPQRFQKALDIGVAEVPIPLNMRNSKGELSNAPLPGTKPGIPRLRGLFSSYPEWGNTGPRERNAVEFTLGDAVYVALAHPLAPAAYSSLDQDISNLVGGNNISNLVGDTNINTNITGGIIPNGSYGYSVPFVKDNNYYDNSDGHRYDSELYSGTEASYKDLGEAGLFNASEMSVPMLQTANGGYGILLSNKITIKIRYPGGPIGRLNCPISWDQWRHVMPFINGYALKASLASKSILIDAKKRARYLILTKREYRDELNQLAEWKESKGLRVEFAYVGSGVGDHVEADRDAIDEYIENYYRKNHYYGVYALLVGDIGCIPSGRSDHQDAGPDWGSADSDHIYEVIGDALFPSVYVGRLSVDSSEELNIQINKILNYEKNPTFGLWPKKALLAANSQNQNNNYGVDPTFPSKYAAAVNSIATYGGYTDAPTFNVFHAGAANNTDPRAENQDVIEAINYEVGHVLYRGHGSSTSWVSGWDGSSTTGNAFDQSVELQLLTNDAYPIVYSISCQNGRINRSDCIAENWMSMENAGAVGHYGASINSYTTENHERAKGIFRAIYESGFTKLAPALAEAERISSTVSGTNNSWKSNTFHYILLGDPELTIRRNEVLPIIEFDPYANLRFIDWNLIEIYTSLPNTDPLWDPIPFPNASVKVKLIDGDWLNGISDENGKTYFKLPFQESIQEYIVSNGENTKTFSGPFPSPQSSREWVSLIDNAIEGTPISVEIRSSNDKETELEIRIPGYWTEMINRGNGSFTEISFPSVVTHGAGLPSLEILARESSTFGVKGLLGENGILADQEQYLTKDPRGWFTFPGDNSLANPSTKLCRYMKNMDVGIQHPGISETALESLSNRINENPIGLTLSEIESLNLDPAGARPGIPHLRGLIFAALGSKIGKDLNIEIINEEYVAKQLSAPLLPAGYQGFDPHYTTWHTSLRFSAPLIFDQEFYGGGQRTELYIGDEKTLSEVQSIGSFSGSQLSIPLCSLSDASNINLAKNISCRITHKKDLPSNLDSIGWDAWHNKPAFVNGLGFLEKIHIRDIPIIIRRMAHYLILTPENYLDHLDDFIDWKRSKGLFVQTATVGNNITDDIPNDSDEIDAYIENYFNSYFGRGLYVLLVGDTDVMETGQSNNVVARPDFNNGASDHIYEVIGDSDFASVYVGRLSIDSESCLLNQLGKILEYERNPMNGLWPTKVTLAGNSQNDNGNYGVDPTFPSKYAAAVNEIANYANYNINPNFNIRHAGAADAADPRAVNQDIIDDLESGVGQILYRGHGDTDSWIAGWDGSSDWGSDFGAAEINSLNHDINPLVYSIACQNNRIKQEDCAGENWMKQMNGGSVSYYGASVNSYTLENHERAKGIFKAIYENGFRHLAPALAEAERLSANAYGTNDGCWHNNTFCYLLLGDPEMDIRRHAIFRKDINPNILQASSNDIQIQVNDSFDNPVINKRVIVVTADERSYNGITDEYGIVTIEMNNPTSVERIIVDDPKYNTVYTSYGSNDVNPDYDTYLSISKESVMEGNAAGVIIGKLQIKIGTYPDDNATYQLVPGNGDDDNNKFSIVGSNLILNQITDYEIQPTLMIRVGGNAMGTNFAETLSIQVIDDRNEDSDGDGLTQMDEEIQGTSDSTKDSDGDSIDDNLEIELETLGFNVDKDDSILVNKLESSGLFKTKAQYDAVVAERDAKLTLDEVKDLRAGSTMIEIDNGQATLSLDVEQSNDLGVWTNGSASSIQIPVEAGVGKKFFRFKFGDGDTNPADVPTQAP